VPDSVCFDCREGVSNRLALDRVHVCVTDADLFSCPFQAVSCRCANTSAGTSQSSYRTDKSHTAEAGIRIFHNGSEGQSSFCGCLALG